MKMEKYAGYQYIEGGVLCRSGFYGERIELRP